MIMRGQIVQLNSTERKLLRSALTYSWPQMSTLIRCPVSAATRTAGDRAGGERVGGDCNQPQKVGDASETIAV